MHGGSGLLLSPLKRSHLPNNSVSAFANDILDIILIRDIERDLPGTSGLRSLSCLLSHGVVYRMIVRVGFPKY